MKENENLEQFNERMREKIIVNTAWLVVFFSMVWSSIALYLNEPLIAGIASIAGVGSFSAIVLDRFGYSLVGRIIWFVSGIAAVTIGSFVIHPAGDIELMHCAMIGGPFLVFSFAKEKRIMMFFVLFDFLCWGISRYLGYDYFGAPIIDELTARTYFSIPSLCTAMLVITLEMSMFAAITNRYNRSLLRSNEAAQEANRAKSQFLATMSHEIRTPMNGVIGMAELLESSDLNKDQLRMLGTIQESSFALLRIIGDVLDMSKMEAGKLQITNAKMQLLPVVESAIKTLTSIIDSQHVTLLVNFDSNLPESINCDADRLRQIIINLLGNAIKFSSQPDDATQTALVEFDISLTADNDIKMTFTDNGIGMDKQTMEKIFEPFNQAEDVTKRKIGGTGLGLAIVNQLVTNMDGEVTVESNLNAGSSFIVKLPIMRAVGKIAIPDLHGWKIICSSMNQYNKRTIDRLIKQTGATVYWAQSKIDCFNMLDQSGDLSIAFYIDSDQQLIEDYEQWHNKNHPERWYITALRGVNNHFGLASTNNTVIQFSPIMPSELWDALSVAAGQKNLDKQYNENTDAALDEAQTNRRKVLLAEDNIVNQAVIKKQLEILGYTYDIASDGEECLSMWQSGSYQLVLTDCYMPKMSGYELAEKIREIETRQGLQRIPIIAITANALVGEEEKCRESGMDDYLPKPLKMNDLKVMLQRWRE